jgi:hypothetical protein
MHDGMVDNLGFARPEIPAEDVFRRNFVVHDDRRLEGRQGLNRACAIRLGADFLNHGSGYRDLACQGAEPLNLLDLAKQD